MNDAKSEKVVGDKISQQENRGFKYEKGNPKDQSKGSKGKRGKFRGKGGSPRNVRTRGVQFNDVSWYMRNKTIAEAFAKIPFNYIVGNKPTGMLDAEKNIALPCVASFCVDWAAAPVNSDQDTGTVRDVLNQVASIVYNNIRKHNSGATNGIEFVDVIVSNLIAGIDIAVNCHYLARDFKIANSFSWKNRMIPRTMFEHLGIDYDDFIANQANYRGKLDTLIAYAQTIRVMNNYPFVDAIMAEFDNVFKDSETETGREQLLLPVKHFHHIYDATGTASNPGGMVRLMKWSDISPGEGDGVFTTMPATEPISPGETGPTWSYKLKTHPFSTELTMLQKQISALVNDSDFNLIQADIEKAFGDQGSYIVPDTITSEGSIQPIYSGEFSAMFHNGTFAPLPEGTLVTWGGGSHVKLHPHQYENTVYQKHDSQTGEVRIANHVHIFPSAVVNPGTQNQRLNGLCDSDQDDPSVEDIIMMTRYKTIYTGVVKSDIPIDFRPGTEVTAQYGLQRVVGSNFILFGCYVTSMYFTSGNQVGFKITDSWDNSQVLDRANVKDMPLMGFEHRPLIWYEVVDAAVTGIPSVFQIGNDIGNIRCLTPDELFNLNEACFLSLWSLPELTTI